MTCCWHRWNKWSEVRGCVWSNGFHEKIIAPTQNRVCTKCGRVQSKRIKE